jgi:hypothetical protein
MNAPLSAALGDEEQAMCQPAAAGGRVGVAVLRSPEIAARRRPRRGRVDSG